MKERSIAILEGLGGLIGVVGEDGMGVCWALGPQLAGPRQFPRHGKL